MFTKSDIEKYFTAEKRFGMLFLVIGIIAVSLALYFFGVHKEPLQKGLAIPILVIGIFQAVAGFSAYDRSDKQRIDNVYAYDMNPSKLQDVELARMKAVQKNFVLIRWLEIFFLAAGILLVVISCDKVENKFLRGIGIGLLIQSAILLTADFFAERRAVQYARGIAEFLQIK